MKFDSILTKFGQDIGVGPVTLDEQQSCYLRFNQHTIVIEHSTTDQCLFIYTSLLDNHPQDKPKYYEHLLTANHFGQGSGTGWFSYNPETQETFLMSKIQGQDLEYDDFVLSLEGFLSSIDHSLEFLENLKETKESAIHQNFHMKNPFA